MSKSKNKTLKQTDVQEPEFDMLDIEEMLLGSSEPGDDTMLEMFARVASIDRDQSLISLDLTKLILEHASDVKLKEKDILATYKRAKEMVSSCSPLQEMFEKAAF